MRTINRSIFTLTVLISLSILMVSSVLVTKAQSRPDQTTTVYLPHPRPTFDLEILVNGRSLPEYYARGRTYVQALEGAEYELRVHNATSDRVAVALAVDGLNTIDARHTSAWNASKWVIEPYGTITIAGWQMSTARARHFYFTTEAESYGAKLGQTANLGVISAVVFRERKRGPVMVVPAPLSKQSERDDRQGNSSARAEDSNSPTRKSAPSSVESDESAATGIGRSVRNDVTWIQMDLESNPLAEFSIRYEYYSALLRLGIVPRTDTDIYPLRRREDSRGFSPEPR